ncbi:disintegrin and metalloproteinase domain-containing protein 32 [Sigmodon hispidus]
MQGTTLCPLLLLWTTLGGMLATGPDNQSSFVQIIVPEKIEDNATSEEQISYVIPIDKESYVVQLQRSYFLADHFMVYSYNKGYVTTHSSNIPTECYYQGYIKGHPNSVAMLSTCSGLRGILQFENMSYGIQPLDSTINQQHIIYKLGDKEDELTFFNKNSRSLEILEGHGSFINEQSEPPLKQSFPLYLEMSIVVDKALYDYLGSDSMIVTNKIIEVIGLINSLFSQLNVTVVLSSLELWSEKSWISTAGEPEELLRRFLEWKQTYLTLRPHDIAYLFIYNEYPDYIGTTYPGKMCAAGYSAGITMYPRNMTLEAFSVVVTQMLGFSLGISYDDPAKCHCPETICVMNPKAMQSAGTKVFSNCSLNDFENFKSHVGAKCLQNKPQMQNSPRPVCGNGKVEGNEICDCGTVNQCGPNSCCEPTTCVLKPNNVCDSMDPSQVCCKNCQFLPKTQECRAKKNPVCDIPEFCNGSSAVCTPDVTIHNGHSCKAGGFICFNGDCPDLDERCKAIYGEGSQNAPFACYEEIQGQNDRFGNCGKDKQKRFIFCGWRNLICGKLICTYPKRTPYNPPNNSTASVIYAFVRDHVCISVDFGSSVQVDPLMVFSGSICDIDRICLNNVCVEKRFFVNASTTCSAKCNGNGVCNSLGECHCNAGYSPPNCATRSRSSRWLNKHDLFVEGPSKNTEKKWLLSLYIVLIILTSAIVIVIASKGLKHWLSKEEESMSTESKSEDSTHTYTGRSKSHISSGTPTNSY